MRLTACEARDEFRQGERYGDLFSPSRVERRRMWPVAPRSRLFLFQQAYRLGPSQLIIEGKRLE
jgi:hypothetical protein